MASGTSTAISLDRCISLLLAKPRLFIASSLCVMLLSVLISYALPKKYEAKSVISIEQGIINDLVKGIAVTSNVEDKVRMLKASMLSRPILKEVLNEVEDGAAAQAKGSENSKELEDKIKYMQTNIFLNLDEKRGIFEVVYADEDPVKTCNVVNTLVRKYNEYSLSYTRKQSYEASKFLSEQIETYKTKVDALDGEINAYKKEKNALLSLDENYLRREIDEARMRLDEVKIKKAEIESSRGTARRADPVREQLAILQGRLREAQAAYTDDHPEVKRLKAAVSALRLQGGASSGDLAVPVTVSGPGERTPGDMRALTSMEGILERSISGNTDLLRQIPNARAGLEELERERNTQRAMYDQLVMRHGQSEMSKQMELQDKSSSLKVVDPAVVPAYPVRPNRVRIMLMGVVGGIACGIGLLVLLDMYKGAIHAPDSLDMFGVPVAAVIGRIHDASEVLRIRRSLKRCMAFWSVCVVLVLAIVAAEAMGLSPGEKASKAVVAVGRFL